MRKDIYLTIVGTIFLGYSCKKDYTCECTEYYSGQDTTYQNVISDTLLEKKKEDEAVTECDALDKDKQTVFTDSYWVDCELK